MKGKYTDIITRLPGERKEGKMKDGENKARKILKEWAAESMADRETVAALQQGGGAA